jgi:DNA-binding NtrC family response regulator
MSKSDKILVFIVDDDALYLKSVIIGLGSDYKDQVEFKYFYNSSELFSELKSDAKMPDLILLDYNLEINLSGIEIIKKIKSINSTLDVVVVSSQKNLQTVFSSIKTGARTYIQKSADVLTDIKKVVEQKISVTQEREKEKMLVKTLAIVGVVVVLAVLLFFVFSFKVA